MEQKKTPFWDTSLSVEERLNWLLAEMTIEEKLCCLASGACAIERLGIPAMSLGGEAAHGVEARNDQNDLGEPEPTTSFVQPIGMSATWDPELIQEAGTVTGTEARVIYHRHPDRGLSRWAPTVDVERDPRWGRTEEGYGEDPLLIGKMASAYVRGMQGNDKTNLRVAATLKHFYGNNTECGRGWKNSSIDPRNKYELYLEPFGRVIEEGGAEAVMTAYNKINGVPGMLNREVLDILKGQYGLKHAVSDGGAMALVAGMHHYCGTDAETLAGALKAGVDTMSDDPAAVAAAAHEAWELGLITEEEVDRSLRNTFGTKLRLGVYDSGENLYDRAGEQDMDSVHSRSICRQVSREAVVLLKNEGRMLPLDVSAAGEIALIGPMGDAWYPDWYGGTPPFTSTLKEGLEEFAGLPVPFADGADRVRFWNGNKGIAAAEDGSLFLGEEPDEFILEDWGEDSVLLRCVRTGMYMNTRFYPGDGEGAGQQKLAAEKSSTLDWFVMEIFHIREQEDGSVILANRFDRPVVSGEGGLFAGEGEPVRFTVEVVSSGISKARSLASEKKTVVLALGCNSMVNAKETQDRGTIALPPAQEKLLEAVLDVNPNVVLVLFSNYPYAAVQAKERIPAILWSATGAQDMGIAMAETLFGDNAPAGRLNMTWYRSDEQLPDIDDYDIIKGGRTYRYFAAEPLYPFGHGLTYTEFTYSDLQVKPVDHTELAVSFTVSNTGSRESDEVAQVYAAFPSSRVKRPRLQMLGFSRLKRVKPGESRTVRISVPLKELRFYDVISRRFMVAEGSYRIMAGPSSEKAALTAYVEIPGEKPGLRAAGERIAADHYDDYENIELSEGRFGYSAVVVRDSRREGVLHYRDFSAEASPARIRLYMKCENGGSVRVCADGRQLAQWDGNTREYERMPLPSMGEKETQEALACRASWKPIYTEVELTFSEPAAAGKESFDLELILCGDVRLCYFKVEK